MWSSDTSRRQVLGAISATALVTNLSGCSQVDAQIGENSNDNPQFVKKYATDLLGEPVIRDGPTPKQGPVYFAKVISSRDQADKIARWEILPEHAQQTWKEVDYSANFVAVFLSREIVTPNGSVVGDQPLEEVAGDKFKYTLDISNSDYQVGSKLFTQLSMWKLNGSSPPKETLICLKGDGDEQ